MAPSRLKTALIIGPSLIALSLAACDRADQQTAAVAPAAPLAGYQTTADNPAPPLPQAAPAPVARAAPAQAYPLAERAYGLQEAFYDAPPAYGFDYGDTQYMAWETQDDWSMYAEPNGGQEAYYYYRPGAQQPYFVRDDRYGYGYDDGGVLVALFDSRGGYLPVDRFRDAAPLAGRYYARGGDLRRAARKAPRAAVRRDDWQARAPRVQATAQPWLQAARNDRDWQAWRERDGARDTQRFQPRESRLDDRRDDRSQAKRDQAQRDEVQRNRDEAQRQRDQADRQRAEADRQRDQVARDRDRDRDREQRQQADRQGQRERQSQEAQRERDNQQAQRERETQQQRAQQQRAEQTQRDQAQKERGQREQAERQRGQREQAQREQGQREQAQRDKAQRDQVQREQRQREPDRPAKVEDRPTPRAERPAARPERPEQAKAPAKSEGKSQGQGRHNGDHDKSKAERGNDKEK